MGYVQTLTRSKARDLNATFHYESEGMGSAETFCKEVSNGVTANQAESAQALMTETDPEIMETEANESEEAQHSAGEREPEGIALTPASASFQRLKSVEQSTLIAEQEINPSLQSFRDCFHKNLARKNVTLHK